MIPLNNLAKGLQKSVVENSPTILTALGVTGVLSTAFLAGKAAFRAADVIRAEEEITGAAEPGWPLVKDRFLKTWVLYIPPAAVGAATIVCILGANTISSRRNTALISGYALTEAAFKEYKLKTAEMVGENKERKINDATAQDQMQTNPVSSNEVIITYLGDHLCLERFTGRYFNSSTETIRKAQNNINLKIVNNMYASLNDFYSEIGLSRTDNGDEIGWNNGNPMDIQFTSALADDGRPCVAITYRNMPETKYDKIWG